MVKWYWTWLNPLRSLDRSPSTALFRSQQVNVDFVDASDRKTIYWFCCTVPGSNQTCFSPTSKGVAFLVLYLRGYLPKWTARTWTKMPAYVLVMGTAFLRIVAVGKLPENAATWLSCMGQYQNHKLSWWMAQKKYLFCAVPQGHQVLAAAYFFLWMHAAIKAHRNGHV